MEWIYSVINSTTFTVCPAMSTKTDTIPLTVPSEAYNVVEKEMLIK